MTSHLSADMDGSWVVETASGFAYLVDLDAMTACRLAVDTGHVDLNTGENTLRRDGETLPLLDLPGPIQVGEPAHLVLGDVATGSPMVDRSGASWAFRHTDRITTPVVSIRRLAGAP